MGIDATGIPVLQRVTGAVRGVVGSGSPARGAFWAPGLTLAAVAGAATMGPSLFPRDPQFQAAAVGASALLGFGAGSAVEAVARGAGRISPGARMGTLGALAGAGLLAAGAVRLRAGEGGSVGATGVGTAGAVTAAAAGASIAATALARHAPGHPRLAQLALPVVAGGAVLANALRDERAAPKRYLLPEVELPTVAPGTELATRRLERLEPTDAMPGVDPATVQLDRLPANGRRFLYERTTAAEITATMGRDAVADPRRVYVGLDEAPAGLDEPALVEWMADRAMERLEATGAFERSRIMVVPTTSTGFINPQAPMAQEMMSLGDVATVGMQAGHRKAVFELRNLDRAAAMHDRLLTKLEARVARMPASDRPTIDVYGESFGAWTSQNVFTGAGIGGLDARGVDHAMYVGSPRGSAWRREVTGEPGALSLRSAAAARDLSAQDAAGTRVTFLTHDADPVSNFAVSDLWRRPEWLPAAGPRGENIADQQRWWPGVTGVQTAIDQQRAQYFTAGVLEAKGHDYRPEVAFVMRRAFGHADVTDEQVARIREYGRQAELRWTDAKPRLVGS